MTFEKEFPSLKGKICYKCGQNNDGAVHETVLLEHCLDKQQVRETITKMWEDSSSYEEFKKEVFYWLEELGP